MNKIVYRTGMLSSILCLISFVVWVVSFVGIAATSPLFIWTNMSEFIDFISTNNQTLQYLAKGFMVIFSISFLILAFVLNEIVKEERKLFSKLAIAFAIMFACLSCLHYWAQITSVRWAIEEEVYNGLQHFIQSYPRSFSSSVNMFAWTVLLGFSNLLFYLAFRSGEIGRTVRTGFLTVAISCLIATFGFLTQIDIITFLCINIGLGLGFFLLTISIIKHFINVRS